MVRYTSMSFRMRLASVLLASFLIAPSTVAQSSGDVPEDMKSRIYDILFRSDADTSFFFSKMTMRFDDSDSQLVALIYPAYPVHPGGQAEVISYTIIGMGNDNLSHFITKAVARNPNVTAEEIAAALRVEVKRSPVKSEILSRSFDDLRSIRVSPLLVSRVAVDEYSQYEFWYNTGQESVHYKLVGLFKKEPQDKLVQWMIRFRSGISGLVNAASVKP